MEKVGIYSYEARQNLLKNTAVLENIRILLPFQYIIWKNNFYMTPDMVAHYLCVNSMRINRYIEDNTEELKKKWIPNS